MSDKRNKHAKHNKSYKQLLFRKACIANDLESLEQMSNWNISKYEGIRLAFTHKHYDFIKKLIILIYDYNFTQRIIYDACEQKNYELADYIYDCGKISTYYMLKIYNRSCLLGNLNVMPWVLKHDIIHEYYMKRGLIIACKKENLDLLDLLLDHGIKLTTDYINDICSIGNISFVFQEWNTIMYINPKQITNTYKKAELIRLERREMARDIFAQYTCKDVANMMITYLPV
jgi:hypothetical protein